jgi:hypothetical protein
MTVLATIDERLRKTFSSEQLEVSDESHLHAGNHHVHDGRQAEYNGTGKTPASPHAASLARASSTANAPSTYCWKTRCRGALFTRWQSSPPRWGKRQGGEAALAASARSAMLAQ